MSSGLVFGIAALVGAALLALWVDVRFPSLAPRALVPRLVALVLAAALLNASSLVFEQVLSSPRPLVEPKELAALAVLLPPLVLSLLTGLWLLRSLTEVAGGR